MQVRHWRGLAQYHAQLPGSFILSDIDAVDPLILSDIDGGEDACLRVGGLVMSWHTGETSAQGRFVKIADN